MLSLPFYYYPWESQNNNTLKPVRIGSYLIYNHCSKSPKYSRWQLEHCSVKLTIVGSVVLTYFEECPIYYIRHVVEYLFYISVNIHL